MSLQLQWYEFLMFIALMTIDDTESKWNKRIGR